MSSPVNPIFCAIDTTDIGKATGLAVGLSDSVGGLKLGMEFFYAHGPRGLDAVRRAGRDLPLFLDLKFHDIPTTVAGAVRAVVPLKPYMINVHAGGGREMMRQAALTAAEVSERLGVRRPLVVAVTVLTSLDDAGIAEVGLTGPVLDNVVRLATLARDCGLDGVVCSARETRVLRAECGSGFKLVVPGVRPAWSGLDDQKRVVTPAVAVAEGADILVIGRPITSDIDPGQAARRIVDELSGAGRLH